MDQEIISMFKEKNRSILIQNLKFDTERNIDSLLETLKNIIMNDFGVAKKNIKLIFDDYDCDVSDEKLCVILDSAQNKSYKIIEDIVSSKKQSIIIDIDKLSFEEESMYNYYSLIDGTTNVIQEMLVANLFSDVVADMSKQLLKFICMIKNENVRILVQNRIRDYINIRLYKKLEDKILSTIRIRDNNLINKGKESYDKYQEISKKTTHA